LLIIFMVTAPTLSYSDRHRPPAEVEQPAARDRTAAADRLAHRRLGPGLLERSGAADLGAAETSMEGRGQPRSENQPQLEIDTSPDADYGVLAKVLASAKNAGMIKIGFVQPQG
jgi:biopolymer transport protein ExbD